MPLPFLRIAEYFALGLSFANRGPDRLRYPLHGRFGNTQTTHFQNQLLRRFAEGIDRAAQRNDLLGRGGLPPGIQPNGLIPGDRSLAAILAMIVMPMEPQFSDQTKNGPPTKTL